MACDKIRKQWKVWWVNFIWGTHCSGPHFL